MRIIHTWKRKKIISLLSSSYSLITTITASPYSIQPSLMARKKNNDKKKTRSFEQAKYYS